MKFICLLTFLSFSAFCCEIETFPKVIFTTKASNADFLQSIRKTNCSEQDSATLFTLIKTTNKKVNSRYLNNQMKEQHIHLSPDNAEFIPVSVALSEQSESASQYEITSTKSLSSNEVINLDIGNLYNINCQNCDKSGPKTFLLTVTVPYDNSKKQYWFDAKLLFSSTVVKNKILVGPNTKLNENMIDHTPEFIDESENYFTDFQNIQFYKLTREVAPNTFLKNSDLLPVDVIRQNQIINAYSEINGVSISTKVQALKNAKFGELIPLKNLKTNKTIIGKATDFNSVRIEL